MRLVYGGAHVGMMGALADAARAAGGEVIGVIPQAIVDREVGHTGLDDLRVVDSMHERKALMAELADAFVALPGGIGTLEELFEVYTWAQLGIHAQAARAARRRRLLRPARRVARPRRRASASCAPRRARCSSATTSTACSRASRPGEPAAGQKWIDRDQT